MTDPTVPPGSPGILPRWTSSSKSAIGTAAGAESRIWFTVSHGILNEVYAPRLDTACIRDFGLIITAKGYFSEEKRDADHAVTLIEDGIPAFCLVNTSKDGRYRITKLVFSDPDREVILQEIYFEALTGELSDYQVHAIIAPTLLTRVLETRPGAVTSRGAQCCLRKRGGLRSQSSPRCHGRHDLSAMSARPMVGKHYRAAKA